MSVEIINFPSGSSFDLQFEPSEVLRPDVVTSAIGQLAGMRLASFARLANKDSYRILDLGTGTGAFLIAALMQLEDQEFSSRLTVVATDANPIAVETATANIQRFVSESDLDVSGAVFEEDFWVTSKKAVDHKIPLDLVLFNPPYLTRGSSLMSEFTDAPNSAVFTEGEPDDEAAQMARIILPAVAIGGSMFIREPSSSPFGSITERIKDLGLLTTVEEMSGIAGDRRLKTTRLTRIL